MNYLVHRFWKGLLFTRTIRAWSVVQRVNRVPFGITPHMAIPDTSRGFTDHITYGTSSLIYPYLKRSEDFNDL